MDELDEIRKKRMENMMKDINNNPVKGLPNSPVTVTDATIDSMASQYPLFILDCWAEWCGPCRMIGPIIEELAVEMAGKAVFGKLNVDQNAQTANRYKITAIPTLMIFKDGKLIDKWVGAYPKQAMAAKLQRYL